MKTTSIAMCTFNGEKYLEEQLESFINQTQLPDELIICDDHSTDNTIQILNSFANKAPFKVIVHQNSERLGTISNFEKAISLCEGKYIFLADQDDLWLPNKLEKILYFFRKDPNTLLLFTDAILIDAKGNNINGTLWEKWDFAAELREKWKNNNFAFSDLIRNNNKITGATMAFNSVLKNEILPFRCPKGYWHDCWIGIFASKHNGLSFLEEKLIKYRVHKDQQVGVGKTILEPTKYYSFVQKVKRKYQKIKNKRK